MRRGEVNIKIIVKTNVEVQTGFILFRTEIGGGLRYHGNEPLGVMKGGQHLTSQELLNDFYRTAVRL
jgi:hypothetical protein